MELKGKALNCCPKLWQITNLYISKRLLRIGSWEEGSKITIYYLASAKNATSIIILRLSYFDFSSQFMGVKKLTFRKPRSGHLSKQVQLAMAERACGPKSPWLQGSFFFPPHYVAKLYFEIQTFRSHSSKMFFVWKRITYVY